MLQNKLSPKIIVICGPTSIGKTKFAIDVASEFNGEIVSADSMQIYRYMDIGTAKPTSLEQSLIYHHMIDIIDPDQHFDAVAYSGTARTSIGRILERGRNVFVVGGTGLYIRALVKGLFDGGPSDISIRSHLKQECIKHGSNWLHDKLLEIDKNSASRIHKNDVFRIIRAIEIFELTGKTMTDLQNAYKTQPSYYKVLSIGVFLSRAKLYERINERVDDMIEHGFVNEVQKLLNAGYSPKLKSMKSLGYRHIVGFLKNYQSWGETLTTLKRDHRRYAKRQLTWFSADFTINWFSSSQFDEVVQLVRGFL